MSNYAHEINFTEDMSLGIPTFYSGLYYETLVCNGTGSDIVVIGSNNNKVVITPDMRNNNGCVIIIKRFNNGKRELLTITGPEEIKCKTTRYEIPKSFIEKGSYYHEASDLLFATPDVGSSVVHPNSRMSYDAIVTKITESMDCKLATHVVFAINDPLSRVSELYGCIGDHCFKILCSNMRTKGPITLTVKLNNGVSVSTQETIDIEELLTTGVFTAQAFDKMLCLGRTAAEAMDQFAKVKAQDMILLEETINKRVLEQRKILDKKQELEKQKNENDIQGLKRELENSKNSIALMTSEKETLTLELKAKSKLLSEWEAHREFISSEHKRDLGNRTIESKYDEQVHKTTRAKWAESGESAKIVANVAAIIIGTVLVAIIKAYATGEKK